MEMFKVLGVTPSKGGQYCLSLAALDGSGHIRLYLDENQGGDALSQMFMGQVAPFINSCAKLCVDLLELSSDGVVCAELSHEPNMGVALSKICYRTHVDGVECYRKLVVPIFFAVVLSMEKNVPFIVTESVLTQTGKHPGTLK